MSMQTPMKRRAEQRLSEALRIGDLRLGRIVRRKRHHEETPSRHHERELTTTS